MNESPALNSNEKSETSEERALRFKNEEDELEQMLSLHGVSSEAADLLIEQLARKHKAEAELDRIFADLDEFNEYEQRASSSGDTEAEKAVQEQVPNEQRHNEDVAAESEPVTDPPPLEAVNTDEPQEEETEERLITPLERKALVDELNSVTTVIDAQRDIVVRYEADKLDRVGNPKYTKKEYEEARAILASLDAKPTELALAIAGKERLKGDIKIPDIAVMDAYEQKVNAKDPVKREAQKRALSKKERDAYRDAFARKKDFVQALLDHGVRKGAAHGLYKGFMDRAAALGRFREGLIEALEAGKEVVINPGDPDYDLLKWHGIRDGQWTEIIDQINAELEQFNTIPEPKAPERPARVVPLIRPDKKEDTPSGAATPNEDEEKAEAPVPPAAPVPLTGIYELRDGHVYNKSDTSPDALRLDTDELLPRSSEIRKNGGDRSGTIRPIPVPVISAKDGVTTYDRELDPDLAREKETLKALVKNKDLIRPGIAAGQLPQERDPLLGGLYNIENGVVRSGLAAGEGEVVAGKDIEVTSAEEDVSQEVIGEQKEQGTALPQDTKASEPGEILENEEVDSRLEEAEPASVENKPEIKTGIEAAAMEKFIALQKIYFAENTELIHKLDEAVARGDSKKVAELEQERRERAETYENEIAEYQRSIGKVSPKEQEELAREAAQKSYEEELDTYEVRGTSEVPGTPSYRELQKKAYIETNFPEVFSMLKKLEDPGLSGRNFITLALNIEDATHAKHTKGGDALLACDLVNWALPHGRKMVVYWDTRKNIWFEYYEGPEDIRQQEFDEEVEDIEEKEDLAVFDPEYELGKILQAPTAERRQLLAAYKEKLAWQKKGLAEVQAGMEEEIRANPEMTQDEFVKRYAERAAQYAPTPAQKMIAERVFARYAYKHKAVNDVREKYPDNKELFKALFGVEPKGDIEVIQGPMTLYFRLHDLDDYTYVFSGASIKNTAHVAPEEIERAKNSGGCKLGRVLLPELNGCVLLEKAEGRPFNDEAKRIYAHEEQHAINRLFDWKRHNYSYDSYYLLIKAQDAILAANNIEESADSVGPSRKEFERNKAEQKLEFALSRRFRMLRENAEEQAKDEILAYAKEGRPFDDVFTLLTRKKSEGGLYDYFSDPQFDKGELPIREGLAEQILKKADEVEARIFGPEYHALLREAVNAYEQLRGENYKEEAIRAILMEEPLQKWKKVADRLAAQEVGIPDAILEKYDAQFNLSERDLKRIEGFRDLSEGQQLLVLKELNNYSVARIKGEALREYRESYNVLGKLSDKESSFLQKGGWWRKLAVGMAQLGKGETYQKAGMALMKRKIIADREKDLAEQMFMGEVDQREFLTQLVRQAKDGPDAEMVEGRLELKFLKDEDIGPELAPEFSARVESFNRDAAAFANTPHAWREYAATAEEKEKYAKAEQQYRRACHEILELKRLQSGDEHASLDVLQLDRKVTLSQFFNTHPDAEEMLADIKDQSVWGTWMLETAQTRGGIMAMGGAIRTAAGFVASQVVSKASLVAAPLAGAVVGGYRGHKAARTEIEERELLAKIGVVDSNKEARNIVDATKLTEKIYRLKEEIDAIPYSPSLGEEERVRRTKLIESLDARYAYTREKIEKGLVNFGGERAIVNRYELLKAFGVAAAESEFYKLSNDDLRKRLRSFIDTKEEIIDERQKAYVNERMRTAALYGAGFGYAGAYMADYFQGLYQLEGSVAGRGAGGGNGTFRGPGSGEIIPPEAPVTPPSGAVAANEAIEAAKREGWMSDTVREMQADAALNKAYIDKIMPLLGRKPEVGLSDAELNALQATDNDPARAAAHAALLKAMEFSPGRLSDDEVARIMIGHRVPTAIEEVTPAAVEYESTPHHGGEDVETIIYRTKAGDNLTDLIKAKLQIMEDLTPKQQENVIQNFIRGVSPEELRSIGFTDVNRIAVGEKIDIGKLNEVLLSKRIGGNDLFTHARTLGAASQISPEAIEAVSASSEKAPVLVKEMIGTLSEPETSLLEKFIGRPISASESHVLHSMKALSHLTNSAEESKFIDEAFTHLELAMREAGRPLTMAEIQRILAGHGSIDTLIEFREVSSKAGNAGVTAPVAPETLPVAPKGVELPRPQAAAVPVETIPTPRASALTPEQIANWNRYTEVQKLPLAQAAAASYLKLDTDRLYGTDMFGKSAPAWLALANRPAAEIFGQRGERLLVPPSASDPFVKIIDYTKEQGFLRANGYEPIKGETVEQFLKRSHAMKVLEDGPRK